MKLWFLFILLNLGFLASRGQAQSQPPTNRIFFSDLPQLVKEKNEKVQASEIAASAAKIRTGYFTRSFLPAISLKAGNESAQLGSESTANRDFWSASAELNLYRGGRDRLEDKIRKAQAESLRAESHRDFNLELRESRKLYWQIVANQKIAAELKEALKNNDENILSAKRRSGAGITTTSDASQFELEKTLLTERTKRLALEQEILKNQLAVSISINTPIDLTLADDFIHPPDSNLPSETVTDATNPDIEILKKQETAQKLKRDQAQNWWHPSIDLYTTYRRPSFLESEDRALARENEWVSGIQLSMNLDQGLENRKSAQVEAMEAQATSLRLSHSLREIGALKKQIQDELRLLHTLIHDADASVEKAEAFLKITKSEYSRGVKNGPDLTGAFAKLYEFRIRRIELSRMYGETDAELSYQTSKDQGTIR